MPESQEQQEDAGPAPAQEPLANRKAVYMTVTPDSWDLASSLDREESPHLQRMGLAKSDVEERAYRNSFDWLPRYFQEDIGAFRGFYDTRSGEFALPQTVNLIAPFQLLAAHARYGEGRFLDMARCCSDWLEENMVETHPMSFVLGGVRDNIKPEQLWTKYTADYVILNLALNERTGDETVLQRAVHGSKFLLQAQNHQFAPKYDHGQEQWVPKGWQSFGRVVVAMIALEDVLGEEAWLDRASMWADHGTGLQESDGCFHLVNDIYYNSDVAADEIRGLVRLYWRTERKKYLDAAAWFAEWHVANQLPNGAWPLSIDRWGVTVNEYVGPGDVPNIAIALLMIHKATDDIRYLVSAVRALRYSLSQQLVPDDDQPAREDPNALWGFWSWDPCYDATMSPDQSTHHVRGYWFFLDYFYGLDENTQEKLAQAVEAEASDPA